MIYVFIFSDEERKEKKEKKAKKEKKHTKDVDENPKAVGTREVKYAF